MQPMVKDLSDVLMQYQEEVSEIQNNESVKTLFNMKRVRTWHCAETQTKIPSSTSFARKLLLYFHLHVF